MRIVVILILALQLSLLSSCTSLQWRATDTELEERFKQAKVPSQISYFKVDSLDLEIRVLHVLNEQKEVHLLFFHGSPSSLSAWNRYLLDTTLGKKANLHAVDRPGYGYSNFGDAMPSIRVQAEIMSALIDTKGWRNIIAVGSSYGGPLVARMAVLNKNIKAVVMISPAIDPKQEKSFWASRLTQWWATRWMVPTTYRVAGDEKTVHAAELAKLEQDWGKIKVPILHLHGDSDDIVPYGNVDYTKNTFQNIKIISFPGVGHEVAWGRSELVKPYLIELIDSLKFSQNEKPRN